MNYNLSSSEYLHKENSTLTHVPSSHSQKGGNSRIQSYIAKLQGICQEHKQKIKGNRPAVEQLDYQRRFFKRICQKQKQKLDSINISLIRQEYEAELQELRDKKIHLHQMISQIHEQAEEKKKQFIQTQLNIQQQRVFLQQSLEQVYNQNRRHRQMLNKKHEILQNDRNQIEANANLIADKEKIANKYNQTCQQIKVRERAHKLQDK